MKTGLLALAAYAATIPAANWMIGNVGECIPNGPCVVPVGFGLMAPSGVLMIGAALVLRDAVHRLLGWKWGVAAIALGAAMSFQFRPLSRIFKIIGIRAAQRASDSALVFLTASSLFFNFGSFALASASHCKR